MMSEGGTPAVGAEGHIGITVLGSGSAGNCILVHCGRDALMIDAGFSAREMQKRMLQAGASGLKIRGILVTHEHEDHVRGLRVCAQQLGAPIFATSRCAYVLQEKDVKLQQISTFAPGGAFQVAQFQVNPFPIPHDAVDPVGFTVECHGVKIGVATDIGNPNAVIQYSLRQCRVLMLESNHDLNLLAASGRPWSIKQRILGPQGHLSNPDANRLLEQVLASDTSRLILGHISRDCNTPEIAENTARNTLMKLRREDIRLSLAKQDRPLETAWAD